MEYLDFRLPAGGFAGPVPLWLACHQRLDGVCQLLHRLISHLADSGSDESSRLSAEGIRRYFNIAAVRHHDDEDIDLFPCMLERLKGRKRAVARSIVARLQDEHVLADRLWRPIDEQLAGIARGGRELPDAAAVESLIATHSKHGRAEESTLLEPLESALQPEDQFRIGAAMAARRGLTWAQLNSPVH